MTFRFRSTRGALARAANSAGSRRAHQQRRDWRGSAALCLAPWLVWAWQEPAGQAPAAAEDLAQELEQLISRVDQFEQEKWARYEATESEEERRSIAGQDTLELYGEDFVELSVRAAGTDVAPRALIQVIQLENRMVKGDAAKGAEGAPGTLAQRALDTLVGEYLASPALSELPHLLYNTHELGKARCRGALENLSSSSPHPSVQARALSALAKSILDGAHGDAEMLAEARRLFVDLRERFGEGTDALQRTFAQLADANLFEIDHLQIGMTAPDFEAVDENGVRWKLSAYRGKVVVLDFWGYW